MPNDKKVVSLSGHPIYRHEARERPFELATGDPEAIEQIETHITKHVGSIDFVWHEIISDLIHVDVHQVQPSEKRPQRTFVTTGMSDRTMAAPDKFPQCRHAELLLALPASWPVSQKAFTINENYWPVRLLKVLARLPHEYDTWLWSGHSMPNGDPPTPFGSNTKFCGAILAAPVTLPEEFHTLPISEGKEINFFAVIPLYEEEMNFKLKSGSDALFEKLDAAGVTEVIDVTRKSVCSRRWWHLGRA